MSGVKTNSNSITAILIGKLNDRKSGFRWKMLAEWNLPADMIFFDGTYSSIAISGMKNKKVDIVGYCNNVVKILIEVKASKNEDLQESQKSNGEYCNVIKRNKDVILKYIIPSNYIHVSEIPKAAEIIEWSQIYTIAKQYDNTGFTELIESFIDHDFNNLDNLIDKGDICMYFNPSLIGMVLTLANKIDKLMDVYLSINPNIKRGKRESLGYYYDIIKGKKVINIWIGVHYYEVFNDTCLFICLYIKRDKFIKPSFANDNVPCSIEGDDGADDIEVVFPIVDINNRIPAFLLAENIDIQNEEFSKLISINIETIFKYIK